MADFVDCIVMHEITMIPIAISHHILLTIKDITICPVLVLSGDEAQQKHIKTVNGHKKAVSRIMYDAMFKKLCTTFPLKQQHRCLDECYENFLNHICYWKHCALMRYESTMSFVNSECRQQRTL